MPKRKTDPVFAKAAKLKGFEKVRFLAEGDLDQTANEIVLTVKTWTQNKALYRKENPYMDPHAEPISMEKQREMQDGPDYMLEKLIESCDREINDANQQINAAIMSNDSEMFRRIADVLDQHKMNLEHVAPIEFGAWLTRNPSHRLATEIAVWAWHIQEVGTASKAPSQILRFPDLWDHLNTIPQLSASYRKMKYDQLKDAKKTVRRVAKQIGILLEKEKPGPRK